MDMPDVRHRLRATFDLVPELYDRARPSYPEPLFDDLVELGSVPDEGHVLEIGCGTGQATLALARRDYRVVCVEQGERLAEAARRKLAAFPNVEVVTAPFETWTSSGTEFDAVVAFTSFHWIDPDVRFAKTAAVLREAGALAIVETSHVANDDPFWVAVQEDYDEVVPHPDNSPPPPVEEVRELSGEIEASGLFRTVGVRRHLWDVTYTADEYLAVLGTYSPNLDLDPDTRRRLFERIHRRAARQGTVTKRYVATLNVARRL